MDQFLPLPFYESKRIKKDICGAHGNPEKAGYQIDPKGFWFDKKQPAFECGIGPVWKKPES